MRLRTMMMMISMMRVSPDICADLIGYAYHCGKPWRTVSNSTVCWEHCTLSIPSRPWCFSGPNVYLKPTQPSWWGHTRVPQPCIFIIGKHVPFVGKSSNPYMHSWAPHVLVRNWKSGRLEVTYFLGKKKPLQEYHWDVSVNLFIYEREKI